MISLSNVVGGSNRITVWEERGQEMYQPPLGKNSRIKLQWRESDAQEEQS